MALCQKPIKEDIFVVTHTHRELPPEHYVFVGEEMFNKYKKMPDEGEIKNIFSKETSSIILKALNNNEDIFFIPDKIWLDNTIREIKIKIFTYLSSVKEKKFFLPQNQQLWTPVPRDNGKKDIILGFEFVKEITLSEGEKTYSYPISYKPALQSDIEPDEEFLTKEGERTSNIQVINQETDILYDIISKRGLVEDINHIFMYMLDEEIDFYKRNNKKGNIKKDLWNGYFLKNWPFAVTDISITQTIKMYRDVYESVKASSSIVSEVKDFNENKINFEMCYVWQMIVWSRVSVKDNKPFRMDLVYSFFRSKLSNDIPFVFFVSPKDKKPFVSIHDPSLKEGLLTSYQLREWIFNKNIYGKFVTKDKKQIVVKIFLYKGTSGSKYITLTLLPNGDVGINFIFEENRRANLKDIENTINKVKELLTVLNTDFLEKQGAPVFPIPSFTFKKDQFILGENTNIQYFNIITSFQHKEIDLDKLLKFSESFTPFVESSILQEKENISEINLKYNRISSSSDIFVIFEFIDKEKLSGGSLDDILNGIIAKYGKTKQEANDIYRQYKVMKEDPQSAKKVIKQSGLNIQIKPFLENKKYSYKIYISGIPSLFALRNCFHFITYLVNSFFFPKFAPSKKVTNVLKNKGITFDFAYNEENVLPNIENVQSREAVSNENELALSNFDINIDKNKVEFSSTGSVNITDQSSADPTVRLKCPDENKILEKGTCKDICDDTQFKLRRLQQFEPKIFHFPHVRGKNKTYSRMCDDARRPIVMAYNPSTNPKIDKESFSYSIKYRSNPENPYFYYICPEAWCPICEIPINLKKVKNVKTIRTKRGECEFGICPNGKHQVYINAKGKEYKYPGFNDPSGNPSGLCMPCCFKNFTKSTITYKRCTNEEENTENIEEGWKYINRSNKIPLDEGRFGLLPPEISVFLGQKECVTGNIKVGFDCLVRKGIKPSPKQSFFYSLVDVISTLVGKKLSENDIKKRLINKITESLFISLNSGRVKRIFSNLNKFKNYILDDNTELNETYLWDLSSRPKIFTEEGFNIIILTPFSVFCPFGQNPIELFSLNKPTILILKAGNIYEPIYHLTNPTGEPAIKVLHNSLDPNIKKVIEFSQKGCQSYNEIDWDKAGNIEKTKELTLKETLEKIDNVTTQIIDDYSKTTALLLENGEYLPVKPSQISLDIPYLSPDEFEEYRPLSLGKTLEYLESLREKGLPTKPTYLILDGRNRTYIVGIMLETRRIVPIIEIPLKNKKTKLIEDNMLYYPETNSLIAKYSPETLTQDMRDRLETINIYRYLNEASERYKFELAAYLQEKSQEKVKNKLIELTKNPDKNIKEIKEIIDKLDNEITSTDKEGLAKLKEVIKDKKELYYPSLIRKPCFKQTNCKDSHCVKSGKKCKLVKISISNFKERIIDVFRRFPLQRNEILTGTVPIANPLSTLQPEVDEVLLTSNKIDQQFQKLVAKEKGTLFLESFPDIDIIQPSFEGVDKEAYLIVSPEKEADAQIYSIASLSSYWAPYFSPIYKFASPNNVCDSLYYCFSNIAQKLSGKNIEENNFEKEESFLPEPETINFLNIKDIYANFLLHVPPEKVREIAEIEIRLPDKSEIESMVDVSDFYNKFQDEEKVESIDDLIGRIQRGSPAHNPTLFDVIWLSIMLDVRIVLMRKSVTEVLGGDYINSPLYSVIFYEPTENYECIKFYSMMKGGETLVSGLDSTLRKIIT